MSSSTRDGVRTRIGLVAALAAGASVLGSSAPAAGIVPEPGDVEVVSVSSGSAPGNEDSRPYVAVSADGRVVAFESDASNLVPGDTNGVTDVFVHDRDTGTTERVSVATGGAQSDGASRYPSISADGRYVAFESDADNLGGPAALTQVYVHDRDTGTTTWVSVLPDGAGGLDLPTGDSPKLSADGSYVVYQSNGLNDGYGTGAGSFLIVGTELATLDVDLVSLADDESVPVDSSVVTMASTSWFPDVSADGRYVTFASSADNLVPGDTNGVRDVFVRDRVAGTTERVSEHTDGTQGDSISDRPHISDDGMSVTFWSASKLLVDNDSNASRDVFLRNRADDTTELVSVTSEGESPPFGTSQDHDISGDGSVVVFWSAARDLIANDANPNADLFVRDLENGRTLLASVATDGSHPGGHVHIGGDVPAVDESGTTFVYSSRSDEVISSVTDDFYDIFVSDVTTPTTCPTDDHPFTDVSLTSFAYDDVACIYRLEITTGTSATTYDPAGNVTREQMAAFLGRLIRAA